MQGCRHILAAIVTLLLTEGEDRKLGTFHGVSILWIYNLRFILYAMRLQPIPALKTKIMGFIGEERTLEISWFVTGLLLNTGEASYLPG